MNGTETVVAELKGLSARVDRMDRNHREDFGHMRQEASDMGKALAGLKVKAGVWGALFGMIPASIALLLIVLQQMLDGK